MTPQNSILSWPGKSPIAEGGVSHPAVYHMLDVGAVLELLLRRASFAEPLHQALCLLGTLHDIGKINPDFKAAIEDGSTQPWRHWRVSMALLEHFSDSALKCLGSEDWIKGALFAAVAGHHGRPPVDTRRDWKRMVSRSGPETLRDVEHVIDAFSLLFPEASLCSLEETLEEAGGDWRRSSRALSWWLSGIVSVADWIGSNADWFPPTAPEMDVSDYWFLARSRAEIALESSGLSMSSPSRAAASSLFSFDTFSPMQQVVLDTPLPEGPTLAVIEDATGSGKTEAGLMLALRMMQVGKGEGVFFALPTMATANAMFSRLSTMRRMFEGKPSLALTHSRAGLHEEFRQIIGRRDSEPDDQISCADWFVDGRRKALLAQIGVGTIDQALLGALPTRYCTLRLYALSRQVLIVDEAHDYDSYMQAELERLLTFQGMLGGSAILMTATLPQHMRSQYVRAFQKGAQFRSMAVEGESYPQLSIVGADHVDVRQVEAAADAKGPVAVERIDSFEQAMDLLVEATGRGAACAFIRNSVDEAILAVNALRLRGVKAQLHHARFALCDRLQNERRVLDVFGKGGDEREGAVVVGTQVLEQSLDIDFDFMVSDLAPIGALIQRAGRLWRHENPLLSRRRPVDKPILYVLSPDPSAVNDANWGREQLGRGWFVYALPVLWRTAKELFLACCIELPSKQSAGNVRALIEAVDGDEKADPPEMLESAENERIGSTMGDRAHAQQNLLEPLANDYRSAGDVLPDEKFPTRLGSERVILRLARRVDGCLQAWADDADAASAWAKSEVSVSLQAWRKLELSDQVEPEVQLVYDGMKKWEREIYEIYPVEPNGAVGDTGLQYDEEIGLVFPCSSGDGPQ